MFVTVSNMTEIQSIHGLRKQPTFRDAVTDFRAKGRLRNERGISILVTRHYPDLCSASDWSCRERNLLQPIKSNTSSVEFFALVRQTSFREETRGKQCNCKNCYLRCQSFSCPTYLYQRSLLSRIPWFQF